MEQLIKKENLLLTARITRVYARIFTAALGISKNYAVISSKVRVTEAHWRQISFQVRKFRWKKCAPLETNTVLHQHSRSRSCGRAATSRISWTAATLQNLRLRRRVAKGAKSPAARKKTAPSTGDAHQQARKKTASSQDTRRGWVPGNYSLRQCVALITQKRKK